MPLMRLAGILRASPLGIGLLVVVGLLAVATMVPVPENWGNPGAGLVDVEVKATSTWHPLRSKWSVEITSVTLEPSMLINLKAATKNLLGLGSPSHSIHVTLEQAGNVLAEETDRTGKGGWFGTSSTSSVVFRTIPPGEYVLRARIVDASGLVVAEAAQELRIVPEGGA